MYLKLKLIEAGSFAAYDVGYLKDNTTAATAANTYKYTITTPAEL